MLQVFRAALLSSLLVATVLACTSSATSSGSDPVAEGDASASSPAVDGASCSYFAPADATATAAECAEGCTAVQGNVLDEEKGCAHQASFLGCLNCPEGCGGAMEGGCFRNVDDGRVVYVAPAFMMVNRPGWAHCTSDEHDRVAKALFGEPQNGVDPNFCGANVSDASTD